MLRSAIWLESQLDLEILFIGRDGLEKKEINSRLEIAGKHLGYTVVLDNGGYVFLRVSVLDSIDPAQELFSIPDTKLGWENICKVIQAFERHKIKKLVRPIECGEGGPNSYVIG